MTDEDIRTYTARISGANPTQLVVVMYDMAADYFSSAVNLLKEGNKKEFSVNISRGRRVINNLNSCLDMQYPVSAQLSSIYMYMIRAAVHANAVYDTSDIEKCIQMLKKLSKAYGEVAAQDTRSSVMTNTQQVYAGFTYGKGELNETVSSEYNRGYTV